jgi:hypothetical protein
LSRTCLAVDGIIVDNLDEQVKVTRVWGQKKGKAAKTDRGLDLEEIDDTGLLTERWHQNSARDDARDRCHPSHHTGIRCLSSICRWGL